MPAPTIDELTKVVIDKARVIVEGGEEHVPILFVQTPRGIAMSPIELNDRTKRMWRQGLSQILQKMRATAYIFVCEAWVTQSERPLTEQVAVSSLPPDDKQEILMVHICENNKTFKMMSANIDNTPQGRRLGELKVLVCSEVGKEDKEERIEGRMILTSW